MSNHARFKWTLPGLLKRRHEAEQEIQRLRQIALIEYEANTSHQRNLKGADETWTHPRHTNADLRKAQRVRAENFKRENSTKATRTRALEVIAKLKKKTDVKKRPEDDQFGGDNDDEQARVGTKEATHSMLEDKEPTQTAMQKQRQVKTSSVSESKQRYVL